MRNPIHVSILSVFSIILISVAGSSVFAAQSPNSHGSAEIRILTSHYPPFQYKNTEGEAVGSSITKVRRIFEATGTDYSIQFLPYTRAWRHLEQDDKTCVVSLVKTPARIDKHQWVGPLGRGGLGLFTTQKAVDADPSLAEVPDDSTAKIATTTAQTYLDAVSIMQEAQLIRAATDESALRMMAIGRVDYWLAGLTTGFEMAKRGNIDDLVLVRTLVRTSFHMGCSMDIEQEKIEAWNKALRHMEEPSHERPPMRE